jgi:RHS repeat-associated protein
MLKVDQVHVIRHKVLVEGRSQRQIAKEFAISRVTVRKYVEEAVPIRKESAPRARPVWEKVSARVDALLAESAAWTGGKQQLTATRLHELLVAEGARVGVTLVKEAVAEWRRRRREVFVPLTYRPGDLAEVDFFEVLVDVGGTRRKAWLFLMRLMVLRPRLRVDLRAPGSDQLPRWPRAGLRALRRRPRSAGVRQSACRGFVGGDHDDRVGLVDLGARWYDPALGRFLSRDPMQGLPAPSRGLNPYSYALNEPAGLIDPTGESCPSPKSLPHEMEWPLDDAGSSR